MTDSAPRVLILDSDPGRRLALEELVATHGYRVESMDTVARALGSLKLATPQALILERRVADGTAFDVLAEVDGLPRPLAILHGEAACGAPAIPPAGVDAWLAHPLCLGEISKQLRRLIPRGGTGGAPDTRSGDHLLLVYDDRPAMLDQLAGYFAAGLESRERCLLVCEDSRLADQARNHFELLGLDTCREERAGALVLLTQEEVFFVADRFDPSSALALLRDLAATAGEMGFSGVRLAAEPTWIPATPEDGPAWFNLEEEVTRAIGGRPLTALCYYQAEAFGPQILLEAVRTHPLIVCDSQVCQNHYHGQPLPSASEGPGVLLDARLHAVSHCHRL